jgi:AhpC/TSA family protein
MLLKGTVKRFTTTCNCFEARLTPRIGTPHLARLAFLCRSHYHLRSPHFGEKIIMAKLSFVVLAAACALSLGSISAFAADTKPADAPPKIKVGDMAPDFKLLDQNFKTVSLSDFRGKKNVALAFYVFAFTGG